MRYRCVVKCWWKNTLWSPSADGLQVYEGDDKPPESKSGKPYFVSLEEKIIVEENQTSPAIPFEGVNQVDDVGETQFVKWELNQMPKIELQRILSTKFGVVVEDEVIKNNLIMMIIEQQKNRKPSNQDIANSSKR